jgi:hypothetical protein
MPKNYIATGLCVILTMTAVLVPALCLADERSACWSGIVHEENSLAASLLYLPYMALMPWVRIVNGIMYPVPTTQSTIPPPGHKPQH